MAGKRVDLSTLADVPVQDTRVPAFVAPKTSLPVDDVAPNPLNRRRDMAGIDQLAESIATIGQSTPCAIVTTKAFLAIFPEHAEAVRGKQFVAVTGRRRQLAVKLAGRPLLDVTVKDEFAESRGRFLAVTASENIDRQSFNPIEEAHAVNDLVAECGSGKAASIQLSKSEGWVSQRLALLRLVPALQELVVAGGMPIRVARELGALDPDEQEQAWASLQTAGDETETAGPSPAKADKAKSVTTKSDPIAGAIRKLGATPDEIAARLREHLSDADLAALIRALRRAKEATA